jgi:ABC-type multidrug transport system fused ATPase/permease subunit
LFELLKTFWYLLPVRRRLQLIMLLAFMVIAACFEILTIGAVLPFLTAMTDPELVLRYPIVTSIFNSLAIEEANDVLLVFTIVFCVMVAISSIVRLVLLFVSARISFMMGAEIGIDIYKKTLYQSYEEHTKRNTSDIITVLSVKVQMIIVNVISAILALLTSFIIALAILLFLITINPLVALTVISFFGSVYILVAIVSKKKIQLGGERISVESAKAVKALQEGLGGVRDVILDAAQPFYVNMYRQSEIGLRTAQYENQVVRESPRFLLEGFAMIGIALFAYSVSADEGGVSSALPLLGAIALGSQRLLPLLQNGFNSFTKLRGAKETVRDIVEFMSQKMPLHPGDNSNEDLTFTREIRLENVFFGYGDIGSKVLQGVNLAIPKASKVGIIGPTGGGKSTLVDVLLGLLDPAKGLLTVDGRSITVDNVGQWHKKIAHVPQSIYLSDQTILENIAFGVPLEKIDIERATLAASQACLSETIDGLPNKYMSEIGERGLQLSGGQRQRLGIARALYNEVDLLVLDEATSSLDANTEIDIMKALESLGKKMTIVMIAHRLTTLKNTDFIIKVSNGEVSYTDYSKLIKNNKHMH